MPTALARALSERYRIERELGPGGMATVWLARDLRHDRPVALKVLRPELAAALGAERFLREIRLTANLQHPRIVPVHDSGEAAGFLWYVMAFVEGETLRARLVREGRLPVAEAVRIAREIASALAFAHGHGVVHRDVKPENVLISRDGETLVADFGVATVLDSAEARLTATGLSLGTPAYMAPEQVAGEATDGRTDLYALGCVLYEMLAGSQPFSGASAAEVMGRRFREPPPPLRIARPEVAPALEAAVTRAMALKPADRFEGATQFAAALEPGALPPTGTRRRPRLTAAAVALALVIAGALGTRFLTGSSRSRVDSVTIAVLPVRDLDRGDSSAFAAGLTEDLGAAAAAIPGLLVVSSRSALVARQESDDPRVLGRRLGVGTVLETSMRASGDRLRLVARLVRTSDGGILWSERYDRARRDVIAMQDELARAVAEALRLRFAPAAPGPLHEPRVADPAAYDLYARAVALRQRARSAADHRTAATLLDSAIRIDPGFSRAHGELVLNLRQLLDYGVPNEEVRPRYQAAVTHGLAAAPDEARVLIAAAAGAYDARLRDSAAALVQRALLAAPGDAQVRAWRMDLLTSWWRLDEARHDAELALQLAPLDLFAIATTAWQLVRLGDYRPAIAAAERTLALGQNNPLPYVIRGTARACLGEWGPAFDDLQRGEQMGFFGLGNLGVAHALHGDTAAARAVQQRMTELVRQGQALPVSAGWIPAALGEADSAFAWLERAERAGNPYTGIADFYFDRLVTDPRWLQWARRDLGDSTAQVARQALLAGPRCNPEPVQ